MFLRLTHFIDIKFQVIILSLLCNKYEWSGRKLTAIFVFNLIYIYMEDLKKISRALISVSDKTGIVEFAKKLKNYGVEIISTGGTAKILRNNGVEVIEVSKITGFPELMDGRVKTLHPKIHGAFLALRNNEKHRQAMRAHGIDPIDLVVVNLYPFEQTVKKDNVELLEAVEQIDIGGPAMIRSASKNWRHVAVITDLRLYESILEELAEHDGAISLKTRQRLAALAYTLTADYDISISNYLSNQLPEDDSGFLLDFLNPYPYSNLAFIEIESSSKKKNSKKPALPDSIKLKMDKVTDLRYGENPHQKASLYNLGEFGGIANAEQLHGKEMSFNNYMDAEAAWRIVCDFEDRAVAIVKHTNPSGVGTGETNLEAYERALATDPASAFGGIVALNRKVDLEMARSINKVFTEVVIAPEFNEDALAVLCKKKNLRVLEITNFDNLSAPECRQISGGFLVQENDNLVINPNDLKVVSKRQPSHKELKSMIFAWKVCKHVKSNAIVFANSLQTVGIGAGQVNRVDSVRIAAMRAQRTELFLEETALASDAFFPFRDNVDECASFGVSAIIQPGGSIRDSESIEAADEHGISMVFTGYRHFKH